MLKGEQIGPEFAPPLKLPYILSETVGNVWVLLNISIAPSQAGN